MFWPKNHSWWERRYGLNKVSPNKSGLLSSLGLSVSEFSRRFKKGNLRTMSSKYHVPYLGNLAAASQPSFDTGNVPRTMRRHYFIKLCFREISTPPSVQSTQSNFLEIIISWRILRPDFNDLIGATAAKHRGLINSKIKTKFSIF